MVFFFCPFPIILDVFFLSPISLQFCVQSLVRHLLPNTIPPTLLWLSSLSSNTLSNFQVLSLIVWVWKDRYYIIICNNVSSNSRNVINTQHFNFISTLICSYFIPLCLVTFANCTVITTWCPKVYSVLILQSVHKLLMYLCWNVIIFDR